MELKRIENIVSFEDFGEQVNENIVVTENRFDRIEDIVTNLGNGETGSLIEEVITRMGIEIGSLGDRLSLVEESLDTFASREELAQLTITTGDLNEIMNSLSSQIESQLGMIDVLSAQVAVIDEIVVAGPVEEVWQEFVAGEAGEISTSLEEVAVEDGLVSGVYRGENIDREFVIQKTAGFDLSEYEVEEGELVFEMFIEEASSIEDFATEFGNNGGGAKMEWLLEEHSVFEDGWNEVRLSLNEMSAVEEIDWENSNFFKVALRLNSESRIEFRNIRFEAPRLRRLAQLEDGNDILDGDLDLLFETDQAQAIVTIANVLGNLQNQFDFEMSSAQLRLSEIENIIEGLNSFDSLAVNQLSSHEQRITALEQATGLGAMIEGGEFEIGIVEGDVKFAGVVTAEKLETEVIVAGEYTIANDEGDENGKNTGSVTIYEGEVEIFVENSKVRDNSRIIVTPIGDSPVNWIISEKKEGEGFRIKLTEEAEFEVEFDYWIVQTE